VSAGISAAIGQGLDNLVAQSGITALPPVDLSVPSSASQLTGFASAQLAFFNAGSAVGEVTLSGVSAGSNGALYGLDFSGNQWVSTFDLGQAAHIIGIAGSVLSLGLDYYDAYQAGNGYSRPNFNAGVTLEGLVVPGAQIPAAIYLGVDGIYAGGFPGLLRDAAGPPSLYPDQPIFGWP
jgi:hypothetical protein